MQYRLSHWSQSLVAIVALTGQIGDSLVLTSGPYVGSNTIVNSPLDKPLAVSAEDSFEQIRQLPDTIPATDFILQPRAYAPFPSVLALTSYKQTAFSTYLSRAPPVSA